ncbi:peroxidase family protein [Leptospira kmetyi]|uniref:Adenylate cyclase n=1 Tax=Leptospira kmetyi TaxID=408139 RepID=A0A2M9XKG2_9LEPT|nr:peroxidase family protein [Leptospira kmetyi]AYV54933.1 adenylate cyclase [Leptospira kmetyi]EQA51612.1 adenylate/guanylate cyclase catalytic domain protein [Leptospira kmetyi serovar Malaysia str. Bejo-Iso9]PJZ29546.1 adenylate cyclase [Leptospira kmetyi]PJZ39790.1 adenylate cyclase [Leptospira kmetyi]TGK19156.1 adenylate cyclase [Leptospira kmetyi]
MILVNFENEKEISLPENSAPQSLLEISLSNSIPHTHACGGNARCSTCRVLVLENPSNLSEPEQKEKDLSQKKGFPEAVRLACQAKVLGDVRVRRIVLDDEDYNLTIPGSAETSGEEKEIAILFSDIRDFTGFSESHLPYDVIHILNRYFYKMGDIVLKHGGKIDKYIGDGLMALFGVEGGSPEEVCLSALRAAKEMELELYSLNEYLKSHFHTTFRIGVGVHYGTCILGQLGHPANMSYTAIGDSVNIASRIESKTKKAGTSVLISESLYEQIKERVLKGRTFSTQLKGKTGEYKLYEIREIRKKASVNAWEEARNALRRIILVRETGSWLKLVYHLSSLFNEKNEWIGLSAAESFRDFAKLPENGDLVQNYYQIKEAKETFVERSQVPISFADFLALAGAVAIEKSGGPRIAIESGRKDELINEVVQILPLGMQTQKDQLPCLQKMKLGVRDLVLISGARTIGWLGNESLTSNPYNFDNSYFHVLLKAGLEGPLLIPNDRELLKNDETRAMVLDYALDQSKFFEDFVSTYRKLTA